MVLLVVFGTIASNCRQQKEQDAAAERLAALTPEQRAAEDARLAAEAVVKAKEDRLAGAKDACKQFVEETLHDPDSAEWARYRDFFAEERKDGFFHVQLTVRSKNAFNATRLGTFDCILHLSGDRWYPVSIKQQGVR